MSATTRRSQRPRLWSSARSSGRACLLLLLLSATAVAQPDTERQDVDSPGLLIDAVLGWDGTVSRSVAVPVSLLVRNDSDQLLEAELMLADPTSGQEVSLGQIVVAAKTARRASTIQALDDWDECFAELRSRRQVLWRRELALSTGSEFDDVSNFALFIDEGGRRLALPAPSDDTPLYRLDLAVGGVEGRRVRCLSAKSWQVPNHPGPLSVIQAVVFPEQAPEELLNEVQWIALAKWMCAGGVVFVHAPSEKLIARLLDSAPLDADPVDTSGPFAVRRVGLGRMCLYPEPIMSSEGAAARSLLAATIARLPKSPVESMLASTNWYHRSSARSDLNRTIVLLFFMGYALLIGVVSLMLFRLSQRKIAIYAGVVVGGASILSGLLGGYLRLSRGDLNWTSVTLASNRGVVQYGKIDVRSAGGRSTRVAVTGDDVDLQSVPGTQGWYHWNQRRAGYPPFNYQTDLLPAVERTYQASVAMTPWGRRELRATAYQGGMPAPDFELKLEPIRSVNDESGEVIERHQVSLKVVNTLPFDLRNCMLIVGGTRQANQYEQALQLQLQATQVWNNATNTWVQSVQSGAAGQSKLTDVYSRHPIGNIAAGATKEGTYEAAFTAMTQNNWNQMIQLHDMQVALPKIAHLGTSSAWLIGQVSTSSVLQIDEQHSDFDPDDEPRHLFLQEIDPGDLFDPEQILRQQPATQEATPDDTP